MATKNRQKKAKSSRKAIRRPARAGGRAAKRRGIVIAAKKKISPPHPPKMGGAKNDSAPKPKFGAMNKVWCTQLLVNADTRHLLIQAAGEHAIHVIQEFTTELSDEEIAKKAHIRSSDVRVVLNKLHSFGLATYSRSRDKNSGWYSYVWRLNNEHVHDLVNEMRSQIEGGERTVASEIGTPGAKSETGEAYYCKSCGPNRRLPFETASGLLFKCDQCGSNLEFSD